MNENKYSIFRLAGLALTLAVFIGHYLLPEKHILVHPSDNFNTKLYGYIHPTTGESGSWINKDEHAMQCDYQAKNKFGCGFLTFNKDDYWKGLNLTPYDGIRLNINYEGPSKRIRIYLRNHNNAYSSDGNGDSTKFLSMILDVKEIGEHPIYIGLSEFTVAEWWVSQKKIRRKYAHYEVDNIVNFGIDYVEPGLHKTRVTNITIVGRYIKTKTLLYCILVFWMTTFLLEGFFRFYKLYRKSQEDKSILNILKSNQQNLEVEREKLRVLSSTDPLTGACNRSGMAQHFHEIFSNAQKAPDFGMLLFDIDHFKKINDNYGHDIGDKVLKKFTNVVSKNMRENDILARWGGEEFIVVTPKTTQKKLIHFSEKLRQAVENTPFSADTKLNITISIGATMAKTGDQFEDTFKRADNALYKAKNNGRNCSIYEDFN